MFFKSSSGEQVTLSTAEKKEERQRMEKLLSKYKCSLVDQQIRSSSSLHSLPVSSSPVCGLRRNATFKGRMIKKVPCPVVPVAPGTVLAVDNGCDKSPSAGLCFAQPSPQSHRFSSISTSTTASSGSEESEQVERWLSGIHFDEYTSNFVDAGYDLPTISRITPEDLIAIGITNPLHRKQIKHEISSLSVSDGIPATVPESLYEWLYLLRLEEYQDVLRAQGYDSVDRVAELTWEDFEEIGIKKLGHQKRLALAIKRYAAFVKGSAAPSFSYSSSSSGISSFSNTSSVAGSFPDLSRQCNPAPKQPFRPVILTCSPEIDASMFQRSNRSSSSSYKQKPVAMIAASRPASSAGSSASFYEFVQDFQAKTGLGPSDLMSSASTCSLHSNSSFASDGDGSLYSSARHNYSAVTYDTSSIYATLKRNKRPPPPPPKRTNSVKSTSLSSSHSTSDFLPNASANRFESTDSHSSRDPFIDAMQEQAFATCVKSLASKFSQMASVEDESPDYACFADKRVAAAESAAWVGSSDVFPPPPPPLQSATLQRTDAGLGSSEFPPPPTPLCQSTEDLMQEMAGDFRCFAPDCIQSPERSLSSSSNESLPFANDNVGTIKQSAIHPHCNSSWNGNTSSGPLNPNLKAIDALAASLLSSPTSPSSPVVLRRKRTSSKSCSNNAEKGTVIDDIESMLENLSNQLDAMLEQEIGHQAA